MLEMTALEGREFGMLRSSIFRQIETMAKPVIAAINGFCLGRMRIGHGLRYSHQL